MTDGESLRWAGVAVGALLVAAAVTLAIVMSAAADGRLGPNRWAGLRTKVTMTGPRQWRAAHEAALGPSIVAAVGLGIAGLVAIVTPDSFVMIGVVLAGSVWTVVWALVGLIRGEQAARDVGRRRRDVD
jgi:hypothetical protein